MKISGAIAATFAATTMALPSNFKARSDLDPAQRAFLEKYQPLSDAASKAIGPVDGTTPSGSGFCSNDFPCATVTKTTATNLGEKEEIERDTASALLDQLTASPEVTLGKVQGSDLNGLKLTHEGAVLDIIGVPGTFKSEVLAGMVFDMYKFQSDDVTTNSIRATPAKSDRATGSPMALCLYPEGADAEEAHQFCIGKDMEGNPTVPPTMNKRQISDLLCGIIDIPIVCD